MHTQVGAEVRDGAACGINRELFLHQADNLIVKPKWLDGEMYYPRRFSLLASL
jgi:hypothetical protein